MFKNCVFQFISCILLVQICISENTDSQLIEKKNKHQPLELSSERYAQIAALSNASHFNQVLDEILIPRVVGTAGHAKVQNYIVTAMETLGWQVEQDTFDANTPNKGVLTFNNIVAKLNPKAERFLVVACHYDSKYFPGSRRTPFLGATDSAVPCTMMINMAYTLRDTLEQNRKNDEVSLMFVFFDGEEAFRRWGPSDSIYGARHLAKKLEDDDFLKRIDIMILLDLLGASDPKFYNYFGNTQSWYARLMLAEKTLKKGGHFEGDDQSYFSSASRYAGIEDDHVPFLERDVRILHIIPTPFPEVWHKSSDDRSVVDMKTVENLNKIFRVFLVEYLQLE